MTYDTFDETLPTWDNTANTFDEGLETLVNLKRNIRRSGRDRTKGHNWNLKNRGEPEMEEEA
jgi:hypothetical protein